MSAEAWIAVIAFFALAVDISAHIIGGMWAIRRNNDKIIAGIDAKIVAGDDHLAKQIEGVKMGLEGKIEDVTHVAGEGLTALREKLRDVELWNRDNFVSKRSFELIMGEQRESWRRLEDKVEGQATRFNEQITELIKMLRTPDNGAKK